MRCVFCWASFFFILRCWQQCAVTRRQRRRPTLTQINRQKQERVTKKKKSNLLQEKVFCVFGLPYLILCPSLRQSGLKKIRNFVCSSKRSTCPIGLLTTAVLLGQLESIGPTKGADLFAHVPTRNPAVLQLGSRISSQTILFGPPLTNGLQLIS